MKPFHCNFVYSSQNKQKLIFVLVTKNLLYLMYLYLHRIPAVPFFPFIGFKIYWGEFSGGEGR